MLTFWADPLTDHDEKPRELNVLSHGQRDLWDNHQACLEQKVNCAHTHSQSCRANVFCTQQNEFPLPVQTQGPWLQRVGGWGLATPLGGGSTQPQSTEVLHLNFE